MSDIEKRRTIVAIAMILAGTFLSARVLGGYFEAQSKQAEADAKVAELRVIRDIARGAPALDRFEKAAEDGARAVIRGAADATEIRIGRSTFDEEQIQTINQRAARVPSSATNLEGEFRIFGTDARSQESTRYVLGASDGTEFTVTVNHADFSADDLTKLWEAAKARQPVRLEVTITTNRGAVRGAQIISVL